MYRSDRFSHVSNVDRGPVVITITAALILGVALACGVTHEKKKSDTTMTTSSKSAATQPPVGGEVVGAGQVAVPQNVTFASAQDAYTKRRYREATESFDVYVQKHPKNAFGYYMLGLSAWKSGDLTRARDAFERSLTIDSTNVKTLLNLGRVLLEQEQVDGAFARVTAAVALDSGSAEAHRMVGRVQTARGQRESAMMSYRVALSIDTADSWSMNNLGLLLIDQGRYEEALPPLARAVELRPEAPAFANNLGVALERSGHPNAAADAFRTALKADSTYVKASRSLARVEGKVDSTTVDITALAASFNDEIQTLRQQRTIAKVVVKPDSVKVPER